MNIQIFGKTKCFETKKAQRYFKERKVKFQFIDLPRYGLSPGEYRSIRTAVGGLHALIDTASPQYEDLFIAHLALESDIEMKLLENPVLFRTPIVRNGKKSTVGYEPLTWSTWQ